MEKKSNFNLPNILSAIRLLMVGLFVVIFLRVSVFWAAVIALSAATTDIIDGYIARKYNLVTDLGMLIDPLADKLLQAAICICIGYKYKIVVVPLFFILKELCMIFGGIYIMKTGKKVPPSKWYGKLSSFIFFVCTLSIMFFLGDGDTFAATIILLVALAFMLISFIFYIVRFFRINSNKEKVETLH